MARKTKGREPQDIKADADPMELWNKFGRTDPNYTKDVPGSGRKITAIDAYYQIMEATRAWGPYGADWGITLASYEIVSVGPEECIVKCMTTLEYPSEHGPGGRGSINEIVGTAFLIRKTKSGWLKVDEDAWKKAYTNALTKSLSYIGFSADVFLKKFNDNKYVEEQRRRVSEEKEQKKRAYVEEQRARQQVQQPKEPARQEWDHHNEPMVPLGQSGGPSPAEAHQPEPPTRRSIRRPPSFA